MTYRVGQLLPASLALALGACGGDPAIEPLPGPARAGVEAADPALAVDPDNGDPLLVWVAGDSASAWALYFARSRDRGVTWSAPVRVNDRARDVAPHGEASPRLIAARGGVLGVAWPSGYAAPGRQWGATHMRFARSADGGRTWARAVTLNDDSAGAPASHTFHAAAWEGERDFVVAWLDDRGAESAEADAVVYVARSRDLGATWGPNEAKWGAACPCCRVALARGSGGGTVAAWRKHYPGDVRDVAVGPLAGDDSAQARVHGDDWVYPGCPHTGPAIAVDGRGQSHVAWYTGRAGAVGIRYARSATGSATRFDPATFAVRAPIPTTHVAAAGLPGGGSVLAFDRDRRGAARLAVVWVDSLGSLRDPVVGSASSGADHPAVIALDDHTALVAWTQSGDAGKQMTLAVARRPHSQ